MVTGTGKKAQPNEGMRYLRPFAAMQLDWRGFLIRQPLEGVLNHVLSMPIGQLGARLDDAPACPLGQDLAFRGHVPCHRKC